MATNRWSCATRISFGLQASTTQNSMRSAIVSSPRSSGGASYLGSRERVEVAGRTAILIDDGIATGATTRAALRATRLRKPKKLVLAVPVAPTDSLAAMRQEADEVVCLEAHTDLMAIGLYYSNFWPVPDDEVIELLARFSAPAV